MPSRISSTLQLDVTRVPGALAGVARRDNILYPLSAFFMLLGCFLIVLPRLWDFLYLGELLALYGVITLYEGAVIATIAYVARRERESRDLPVLAFIELLFLLDTTFTVNACLPVSEVGGPITLVVTLLLAFGKIALMNHFSVMRFFEGVRVFLYPAMAFLYLFQIVFQFTRGSGDVARESWTFTVMLAAGVLALLLGFVRTKPGPESDTCRPEWLGARWRRTVVGAALVAVVVQLVGQAWVHRIPFSPLFLLPVALSLVVAWPGVTVADDKRSGAKARQVAESNLRRAIAIAILLFLGSLMAEDMVWPSARGSRLPDASAFRLSLVYAAGLLVYLWRRERTGFFFNMAFVVAALAILGYSPADMVAELNNPHPATILFYALAAAVWLLRARSYTHVVLAGTPLIALVCGYVGARVDDFELTFESLRYWPLVAFVLGLFIQSNDRRLRTALAVVLFLAGVASAGFDPVSGLVYAGGVLAAFVAAAVVRHRAYALVAAAYLPACVARIYAAWPETYTGWGICAIALAFVLLAVGVHVTRSRLLRENGENDIPQTVAVSTPSMLLRVMTGACVVALLITVISQEANWRRIAPGKKVGFTSGTTNGTERHR